MPVGRARDACHRIDDANSSGPHAGMGHRCDICGAFGRIAWADRAYDVLAIRGPKFFRPPRAISPLQAPAPNQKSAAIGRLFLCPRPDPIFRPALANSQDGAKPRLLSVIRHQKLSAPPLQRPASDAKSRPSSGRSSGVEHNLAKVRVESSNLFARSIVKRSSIRVRPFCFLYSACCVWPTKKAGPNGPGATAASIQLSQP